MDRNQHITQDAAEFYAVFLMALHAEKVGVASAPQSEGLWHSFEEYLAVRGWTHQGEFVKHYPQYKQNADSQIPSFVKRLSKTFPSSTFAFEIDEARFRNEGRKADFSLAIRETNQQFLVSLKNYIGTGGIKQPQVSSGTFLSFANSFVFERKGVGTYANPRNPDETFKGSDELARNLALEHMGITGLGAGLKILDDLQNEVRTELLQLKFYDRIKIRNVIEHIVPVAQKTILEIFSEIGMQKVRRKFIERIGLDGSEEILFFDADDSIDSITNPNFHNFCKMINDEGLTEFKVVPVKQSLKFSFLRGGKVILDVAVPLTINTNGAWHRPKVKYQGRQIKIDKGLAVELEWGEIRPRKSKEIATSTNSYLDLRKSGIFN